jgi:uncharacterized membrane protein
MLRTIIERFDLYLLLLCIVAGLMVAFLDTKQFKQQEKQTAYKQAKYFGLGLVVLAVGIYIVRFMFI